MAHLTMNGRTVLSAEIDLPLTGRWSANLTLEGTSVPERGARAVLTFEDGPSMTGTIERPGPRGGFVGVRVKGGAGGLDRTVGTRFYRDIPARTVAEDLLRDSGERLGTVDLPGTLTYWVRPEGTASELLAALLARTPERTYRVLPDGRVSVLVDDWPDHTRELQVIHENPDAGVYLCSYDPTVTPGTRVTMRRGLDVVAKRAARVRHLIGDTLRTEVTTGDGVDVATRGLTYLARQALRHTDYHALFPATVITDHGDHTVDVRVDVAGWPQLVSVPLLVRLPGIRVRVKAGSAALVSFEQGDPARPLVEVRDSGALEYVQWRTDGGQLLELSDQGGTARLIATGTLTVDAGVVNVGPSATVNVAGGGPGIARLGDEVTVAVPTHGLCVGTITKASSKAFSG
ncbi:hypothetical protein [Deinococcus pimensis]|uniref:hypothetical protein n=1 Tax=Deinococcus pimensis TaxID=309888 RepID=UPI0004B4216B|nr:hypothetical protein [Deinococcus pimensis]